MTEKEQEIKKLGERIRAFTILQYASSQILAVDLYDCGYRLIPKEEDLPLLTNEQMYEVVLAVPNLMTSRQISESVVKAERHRITEWLKGEKCPEPNLLKK